jgi:galactonate dehydratase
VVESSLQTRDGYWLPCDEPGLGVRVNEKAAALHPFEQEPLTPVVYSPDGAVRDW